MMILAMLAVLYVIISIVVSFFVTMCSLVHPMNGETYFYLDLLAPYKEVGNSLKIYNVNSTGRKIVYVLMTPFMIFGFAITLILWIVASFVIGIARLFCKIFREKEEE